MPRTKKSTLIPLVNETVEVQKPKRTKKTKSNVKDEEKKIDAQNVQPQEVHESKVQSAIKKARQQKNKTIVDNESDKDEYEYSIIPSVETQPEVKIVEKIVEKPVEKIVEKVIEVEKPIDIFKTEQWLSETKKYNDNISKLQKENELLKKLGTHVDHLSRLSNMSRQMKIKF